MSHRSWIVATAEQRQELRDLRGMPGPPRQPVVLVLDNGPIHISKAASAALVARDSLTIEWLPKYAPELNDIERSWRDLKRHFLAHQTFPISAISTMPSIKVLPT